MSDAAPSATSRLFLLLGDPVEHSLSPIFQNAAIRACGIDAVYAALRCDPATLPALMTALCRAGGGGNVTVPFKEVAARVVEHPTSNVIRTGACNAFWGEHGSIHGDNTDLDGFRAAALQLLPSLRDTSALVLGAGGAAVAAVAALLDAGAARVLVLNRSPERAAQLVGRLDPAGTAARVVTRDDAEAGEHDLVVNATSLGLRPADPLPFDLARCRRAGAALDLVYRRRDPTPFVAHARSLGVPAADGTAMLLAQGAAAFERWFGRPAPLDVMRHALHSSRQ